MPWWWSRSNYREIKRHFKLVTAFQQQNRRQMACKQQLREPGPGRGKVREGGRCEAYFFGNFRLPSPKYPCVRLGESNYITKLARQLSADDATGAAGWALCTPLGPPQAAWSCPSIWQRGINLCLRCECLPHLFSHTECAHVVVIFNDLTGKCKMR